MSSEYENTNVSSGLESFPRRERASAYNRNGDRFDTKYNTASSQGFDSAESFKIASNDSLFESQNSQLRRSYESANSKHYLSVPPLSASLYSIGKRFDLGQSSKEFQALHPNRGQYLSKPENYTAKSNRDVIDIAYLPDPYRPKLPDVQEWDPKKYPDALEKPNLKVAVVDSPAVKSTELRGEIRQIDLPTGSKTRPNDAILGASLRNLGKSPWKLGRYQEFIDPSLAGAASVSRILQEQGYDYADSGSASNLAKKLMVNGWHLVAVSQAKPGDIIFGGKKGEKSWRTGRGRSEIAVVGVDGNLFHNDAKTGTWKLSKLNRVFSKQQYGDQIWVLRAPEEFAKNPAESVTPGFRRDFVQRPEPGSCQYRCACNCQYFDKYVEKNRERPKSYLKPNQSAPMSDGARDGRRAYREMMERRGWADRISTANRERAETDRTSPENTSKYWKNYWKNYWKDYWRDYWKEYYKTRDGRDRTDRRQSPESSNHGLNIHDAAKRRIGEKVWANSPHANILDNGRLGSATSVAQILQSLGYSYATSPGVAKLAKQLLAAGWKPVSLKELRPGDVLYGAKNNQWEKGGGHSHMSIVGRDGMVLHNDSSTGKFSAHKVSEVYDRATYGNRIWALRPPADGPMSKPRYDHSRPGEQYQPSDNPRNRRQYSPTDRIGRGIRNIVSSAINSVGRKMYRILLPESMARLGCAASVSGVLQKAGYKYAKSALVYGLVKQLVNKGWQKLPLSEAKPGDVIYGVRRSSWKSGGGGSHIGIVGDGNTSYHNSSRRRQWIKDSLSRWNTRRYRLGVYVLRPPGR